MKSRLLVVVPLWFFTLTCCGCVPFIVGSAVGALGGYAVSKDTVQGETDKDYDALWQSAQNIASSRGTIMSEDKSQGYLEMQVDSNRAIVRLIKLTKYTTRLRVSARSKMKLPNLTLAEDLFVKILEQTP